MRTRLLVALVAACAVPCGAQTPAVVKHVEVYRAAGRFAGWPANHGIWAWGNEIVVGFEIGAFKQTPSGHAIDYQKPEVHVIARSLDGGEHWTVERPLGLRPPTGIRVASVPVEPGGAAPVPLAEAMAFGTPGFALTFRMADFHVGPSRFYYSEDRGKTWRGSFALPAFGTMGVAARTDYLIDGPRTATVFLSAAKHDGREGRPLVVRTRDGGLSWTFVSFIGAEPELDEFAIQPSSVRIGAREIYTTLRRRGSRATKPGDWIEAWRSVDDGSTWTLEGEVAGPGIDNPPSLVRLRDGRLALTYGKRSAPYGIFARISADSGRKWGPETALRTDAGSPDLGYVRTVQRADGRLVTVYYYNDAQPRERFIGATIWDAGR